MKKNLFVWTEAFNCGEILNPVISSYLAHNNEPINIFATESDFEKLTVISHLIIKHSLKNTKNSFFGRKNLESKILSDYKRAHRGTARLWAHIIKKEKNKYLLHIDADTIILDDVISDLYHAVNFEKFTIAGSRRPYKHRGYRTNEKKLDNLHDVVNTDCFIFDPKKINQFPKFQLRRKIFGKRPLRHPTIDFFDPIAFEIIRKKGKIKYMDSENQGVSGLTNWSSHFIKKRISFAAVGSGINFYKNPDVLTAEGYKKFALASFSLFSKYILNQSIPIPPLDAPELVERLKDLDLETWTLRNHNK
jgi:hypothetical protein